MIEKSRLIWFASLALVWIGVATERGAAQNAPLAAPSTLPADPSSDQPSVKTSVVVEGFRFTPEHKVFSDSQLTDVANGTMKRLNKQFGNELTAQDLEQIRLDLTKYYVDKGYINSGAVLADQDITQSRGIVTFNIVEGKLSDVHIVSRTGFWHLLGPLLRPSYLINRIKTAVGPVLNFNTLKNKLELLRANPNIDVLNAVLKPGDAPGQAVLDLNVTEQNPFQVGLEFANNRSPSVGSYQLNGLLSDTDLTGNSDALSIRYGLLHGTIENMQFPQDRDFSIAYSIPFTRHDTTFDVSYSRSSDLVLDQAFQSLNVTSQTDDLNFDITQPLLRQAATADQPARSLTLSVGASDLYNRTFFSGQPISLSPGAQDGKSVAYVLPLTMQYTSQSSQSAAIQQALTARSTFNFGFAASGATESHSGPDSRFVDWLGQFQYVRLLPLGPVGSPLQSTNLVLRLNAQLSPDPLLVVNQFSLGGIDSDRAYPENQVVRDNAVFVAAELRIPLIERPEREHTQRDILTLIPFIDCGYGWNVAEDRHKFNDTVPPQWLPSVGIGLQFTPIKNINAQAFYGYALNHFHYSDHDPQNYGFHFDIVITAF
jgi:hemolysin activation/secretion protein